MELTLQNVSKSFGDIKALRDINVSFHPGIYGILGPNGAGKSTMINLITDLLARDCGAITYDGVDILKLGKEYRRKIGFMPQEQGFYEHMTAECFLMYMAEIKEIPHKQAKQVVSENLEAVNLTNVANRKLKTFSGGMKQRAILAQAMLGNPEILILDEPTAGLDPKERIHLRQYVSQLAKNRIVLWTTHVVSDIESIADEVLVIDQGSIVRQGSPEELIAEVETKREHKGAERITLEDVFMDSVIIK